MTDITRTRKMGSQTPSVLSYEVHGYGPSPPAPQSGIELVGCQAGTYKVMVDIKHGGFRKTGDPSKWIAGPLTIESLVAYASSGSATTSNTPDSNGKGLTRTWSGDGVGYILGALVPKAESTSFGSWPDLVNVANLKTLAIIGCLNRINPAKAQSWVSAAEGSKTVSMIADRARKLAETWRRCRKGDITGLNAMYPGKRTKRYPKRIVEWDENGSPVVRKNGKVKRRYGHTPLPKEGPQDSSARLWLEFRYGWTPLVYDIVDGLKAIYAQSLRDSQSKRTYTRVFESKDGEATTTSTITTAAFGGGTWTWEKKLTHKVSVKAYAKYQVSDEAGVMNRLNDFGAFDIPRAIWEVVPFSFIVDWFVPIGDWLGAVTPKVGVSVMDSGVTVVSVKEATRTLVGYKPTAVGVGQWPSPPFPLGTSDGFRTESKVRSIGLPIPLFAPFEVLTNFKRLVDVAALMRAARR